MFYFYIIQAITGNDNAAEALMHLSNFNWDLLVPIYFCFPTICQIRFHYIPYTVIFQAAVQHVTPHHTQQLPSEGRSSQSSIPNVTIADDFIDMTASTSNDTERILTIEIEQNGHVINTVKVPEGFTIGKLLLYIQYHVLLK